MNNENETTGSRAILRTGCIFIAFILLTRKQKCNKLSLFPRNQKHDF
ncbi:hypothetical protein HMPREF9413_4496 [Paenibacillus sp. HGF7]|nr:hypothetical protein HMPREF9413_4496 [Paenibacillus sp. HGF7]